MKKTYDMADAAALISMTPPTATDAELKSILLQATDIPPALIGACFSELVASDMPNHLRSLTLLQKAMTGEQPSVAAMRKMFESAGWTDDGENHTTVRAKIIDEEGKSHAEISIKKTY